LIQAFDALKQVPNQ